MNRLYALCLFLGLVPLFAQEEDVEIVVNVLPGRGMKFDREALYRKDQEVIQGVFGGPGADSVNALALLPTGHLLMAGETGAPVPGLSELPRLGCSEPGNDSGPFLAVADGTFRNVYRVGFLPSVFRTIRHIAVDGDGSVYLGGESVHGSGEQGLAVVKLPPRLEKVVWSATAPGDSMTGMTVLTDGTVVVAPNRHPFISRIAADGNGRIPFGDQPHFRTDGANPQIRRKWWLDQGYPEAGVAGADYHRGEAGGVAATLDGNLVFLTSNFVRHKDGSPDFDPMLVKFTLEGEVLWATHLLQGLPALSDHKSPHMIVCPYTGDILATMRQHGHFATNLQVGPNAYLTTDNWLTGNIMIGWIGRIDPDTGRVKAGTMYFPDLGRPPEGGKLSANTLLPTAIATDAEGNVYLAGGAAHRLDTTIHAFQPEKRGDSGFISVFDASLSKLRYANLITGYGHTYEPTALLVTELGPLVASRLEAQPDSPRLPELVVSNPDKNNLLTDKFSGESDVLFSLLPATPWKENW